MAINHEPQVFFVFKQNSGEKNYWHYGRNTWASVYDLTAEFVEPYPIVTGIIFSSAQKKNPVFLPWKDVVDLDEDVSVSINSTQ